MSNIAFPNQRRLSHAEQVPVRTFEGHEENDRFPNNPSWTDDWSIPFDDIGCDLYIDPFFSLEGQVDLGGTQRL
jgi:hypothetical protein